MTLRPLLLLALLQSPQAPPPIPYKDLGEAFVAAHCPKKDQPCSLDPILSRDFARLDLGFYELYYPHSFLSDRQRFEDFKSVATGVADLQSHWLDWFASPPAEGAAPDAKATSLTQAKTDLQTLRSWIQSWKPTQISNLDRAEDKSLAVALEPKPAVVEAAKRLPGLLFDCGLGLVPLEGRHVRLIFSPTRLDFMQFLGFSGLEDEPTRTMNWVEGTSEWTQFWMGWTHVVALEYSPWDGYDPEFKRSQPMAKVGATVMVQHVVQQATRALLHYCEPQVEAGHWEDALALEMALLVCGELNTIEGGGSVYSSGASTQPYKKFVPGGASTGGILPAKKANGLTAIVENQWRKGHGKDFFAGPLRNGQKGGAKEALKEHAKDTLAFFLLKTDDTNGKHLVYAPFFGAFAKDQPYPPTDFLIDYAEFFRSYKTCFVHWLSTQGDPASPEASRAKFRSFLASVSDRVPDKSVEDLLASTYGVPLSAADGKTDTLEWRFLKWLDKGR
jgi:hypothetical protein